MDQKTINELKATACKVRMGVIEGHDYNQIEAAFNTAKTVKGKPTAIVMKTTNRERNLDTKAVPAVLCYSHGPFTWGKDASQAVYHAVVLEEVAKMGIFTRMVNPTAAPAPQHLQDKHYLRKHGPNAYYGQR